MSGNDTNRHKRFVIFGEDYCGEGMLLAEPSGVGLLPLACWDCGFDSCRGHKCVSLVSVVCCQVEVSVSG